MIEYSSDVHGFFYLFHVLPRDGGIGCLEVPGQQPGVDRPPEGPGKAASPQGEVKT